MTNDQKYAANYALSILEKGEMPSLEMLTAAGLSEEDAQKLLNKIETTAIPGPSDREEEDPEEEEEEKIYVNKYTGSHKTTNAKQLNTDNKKQTK